jgi:hypothetical protein
VLRTDTVRLGSLFALGAFLGGSAFALLFAYLSADSGPSERIRSILPMCTYAAGVALLVSVPFTLALEWLRAAGRVVFPNMSWGAFLFGASFGSPTAVLTYPPEANTRFFAVLIISAVISSVSAFILTAHTSTGSVDDG